MVHNADAHVYEAPGWLEPWVEESLRETLVNYLPATTPEMQAIVVKARHDYEDADYRARDEAEITLRNGFSVLGAFIKEERSSAVETANVRSGGIPE